MRRVLDGFPAAEGIALGRVHLVHWGVPKVPHRMVDVNDVPREVERFHEAREWAKQRIRELQQGTEARLGPMEARIFEPQMLMLDDNEVVAGTIRYIEENWLTAARAFEWRMLELQAMWTRTAHPMVLDKLSDLEDLQIRMLHRLLDMADPVDLSQIGPDVIIIAKNLTPSLTVQMDPNRIVGIATDSGTRTSHWAILARSLKIAAIVGLGNVSTRAEEGEEAILDGRYGRLILSPEPRDREVFGERRTRLREWEDEIELIAKLDSVTADGQPVALRANLDLPSEGDAARSHGAEGVGLFRTEFLVVGKTSMPGEEEQFQAYRIVAQAFPEHAVFIRTFDLGGDKFPMFLHMPPEENPFLGWRAIRVCLDEPELFRTQLRAILRSTPHGDVRIMVPLVNNVSEIRQVRKFLEEEEDCLRSKGIPYVAGYKLGILIETPAAALGAAELARHCDFFSIGTNDLVQYTLAVDRTSARLAHLYSPFHPSVVHLLDRIARLSRAAGIEVSVCGEMASTPLGAFLLLGLDITALSMAWPSLPEIKKFIRSIRMEDARAAARKALRARSADEVTQVLTEAIGDVIDLSLFSGRWRPPDAEGPRVP